MNHYHVYRRGGTPQHQRYLEVCLSFHDEKDAAENVRSLKAAKRADHDHGQFGYFYRGCNCLSSGFIR
jgi:hypothetical protein